MDVSSPIAGGVGSSASHPSAPPRPGKLKWTDFAGSFLGRAVNPADWVRAIRLQRSRKAHRHTFDDAQLALYAKFLPSEFLHYGYFDDTELCPEDMSLSGVARAQNRYAELLIELMGDQPGPVLDVGCGMGGLCRMLRDRKFEAVALTPDRLQATHIAATLPEVPVIRSKFEAMPAEEHRGAFGTVVTSESLQYLKLPKALPILQTVLRPGGRWIACDFFHSHPSDDRSCHVWDDFAAQVADAGWRFTSQRDITPHVIPMLRYIHMWATRFGVPLMEFAFLRLRRKQPWLHHLSGGVIERLESLAASNIALIDPAEFQKHKRYMLCSLERA